MTTDEDANPRVVGPNGPIAYVCLLASYHSRAEGQDHLPTGKQPTSEETKNWASLFYGWRDGKRCLAHAGEVIWGEREMATSPRPANFSLARVQRQEETR